MNLIGYGLYPFSLYVDLAIRVLSRNYPHERVNCPAHSASNQLKSFTTLSVKTLRKEFPAGRTKATDLEQQQTTLHQTLLRISGAIQVLEEELKATPSQEGTPIGDAAHADPRQVNGSLDRVVT